MSTSKKQVFQWVGLTVIPILLPLLVMAQGQPRPEKLNEEQMDKAAVAHAEEMADQILSKMAEGSHFEFTDKNASPQLKQQFNAQFQQQAYKQIKSQLGDYQSELEFGEAYALEQASQRFKIYRFKSEFTEQTSEVRMVYTEDNLLAGIFVIPWSDQMQ